MNQAPSPADTWRRACLIAVPWVAAVGTGTFALAVFIGRNDFYPYAYLASFALLLLALALPLAVGQWYGSWKVAWLTLAFEVIYSLLALAVLTVWFLLNVPSPR